MYFSARGSDSVWMGESAPRMQGGGLELAVDPYGNCRLRPDLERRAEDCWSCKPTRSSIPQASHSLPEVVQLDPSSRAHRHTRSSQHQYPLRS